MDLDGAGWWWTPKQGTLKASGSTRRQALQSVSLGGASRGQGLVDLGPGLDPLRPERVWSGAGRAVRGQVGGGWVWGP